jgi:hypothetical protein
MIEMAMVMVMMSTAHEVVGVVSGVDVLLLRATNGDGWIMNVSALAASSSCTVLPSLRICHQVL